MGFEKKVDVDAKPDAKPTVRMKYVGLFKGTQKVVELPIPLIATSQKLEETLTFTRASTRQGPAFCEVPLEWAGALLAVGGNWKVVEPLTVELAAKVAAAKDVCDAKMEKFVLANELVET